MVTITPNGDVPQQPYNFDNSYIPDQLIAGVFPRVTDNVTVKSGSTINGSTTLPRGSVLGQITIGSATSAAKAGGNTGNGTLVLDVTTPVLANAKVGAYTVTCIEAVTNGGYFQVIGPDGSAVGVCVIPPGAGASVTFSNEIKFVVTDGSTDFVVGDGFVVTVAAGSGKYIASVKTAIDGSQFPVAILVDDASPIGTDVNAGVYLSGEFNSRAITYDASWTVATLSPWFRVSIFLKNSLSAADPTNE